jgi:LysR family nitrogen assimilation transcriptional regulator
MSVDFRKLKSFVKIVDAGSVSRASSILRTAQPALSQQIVALETHFKQQLLIRSNLGITPTEAGVVLYRHAQLILKQLEQAQVDVGRSTKALSGRVSIGLATYSTTSTLSLPLLQRMAELHPDITVHINDSFGQVLSELIMTGKMDMAVIYGSGPIKGVALRPLFREELFLIAPAAMEFDGPAEAPLPVSALAGVKLLLPSRGHSVATLGSAVAAGLGATILPQSVMGSSVGQGQAQVRKLVRPATEVMVSLCVSDHLPLSEPGVAARAVLLDIVESILRDEVSGLRPA